MQRVSRESVNKYAQVPHIYALSDSASKLKAVRRMIGWKKDGGRLTGIVLKIFKAQLIVGRCVDRLPNLLATLRVTQDTRLICTFSYV